MHEATASRDRRTNERVDPARQAERGRRTLHDTEPYEPAPLTAEPTSLNFVEAEVPMKVTARMITTAINATISAYSTAVAPRSSERRSFRSVHQVVRPV